MKKTLAVALLALAAACSAGPAEVSEITSGARLKIVFQGVMLFYSDNWDDDSPVYVLLPQEQGHTAELRIPHSFVEEGLNETNGGDRTYRLPDSDDGITAVYELQNSEELSLCRRGLGCSSLGGLLMKHRTQNDVTERAPCHVDAQPGCTDKAKQFPERKRPIDWIAEIPDFPFRDSCPTGDCPDLAARIKFEKGIFSTHRLEGQHYPSDIFADLKLYFLPTAPTDPSRAMANAVSVELPLPGQVEIRSLTEKPILLSSNQGESIQLSMDHLPNGMTTDNPCNDTTEIAQHFRILYRLADLSQDEICHLDVPEFDAAVGGDEACPPGRK